MQSTSNSDKYFFAVKKWSKCLFPVISLICLFACASDSLSNHYSNDLLAFDYPEGWVLSDDSSSTNHLIELHSSTHDVLWIQCDKEKMRFKDTSLEGIAQMYIWAKPISSPRDFLLVSVSQSPRSVTIGSQPSCVLTYKFYKQGTLILSDRYIFSHPTTNDIIYFNVNYYASDSVEARQKANSILKTLQFMSLPQSLQHPLQ